MLNILCYTLLVPLLNIGQASIESQRLRWGALSLEKLWRNEAVIENLENKFNKLFNSFLGFQSIEAFWAIAAFSELLQNYFLLTFNGKQRRISEGQEKDFRNAKCFPKLTIKLKY